MVDMFDETDEDGLTAQEREFLSTPISQMNEEQRRTAIYIKDKQASTRYARNAEERAAEKRAREQAAGVN